MTRKPVPNQDVSKNRNTAKKLLTNFSLPLITLKLTTFNEWKNLIQDPNLFHLLYD